METDAKPSALVLSPEAPFPMAGGGALRTASLLHFLAPRYDVDLLVFRQPGDADPRAAIPTGLVRLVHTIDLPSNGRSLAARAVRNARRLARSAPPLIDRFSGFEAPIAEATRGKRYALGIIEHFWCAPYVEQLSRICDRTVLDLHNIESVLHTRCAASESGPAAFAHRMFHRASLDLERVWLPRFSQVLAASQEDAEAVRSIAPETNVVVYPNAICARDRVDGVRDEAIVFSGNMEYHPNRAAVRYFVSEIWPQLRERWPALVWRLIGKNPQAVREFVVDDPRIELTGPVDDAIAELARARVAVVPLLAGSGTRLKILEAWAAGLPVVSTTVGAEGLGARNGEHLLLADEASGFAEAVTQLLACEEMRLRLGRFGRYLLEQKFTWEKAWQRLDF